ncbi:unnamed protein product [Ascophyllum nodosum]
MVNVQSRKCKTEGCDTRPSFGVAGTKTVQYCAQHAKNGMVDFKSRKCRTEGCGKQATSRVASARTVEYCAQHASGGMISVKSRKQCKREGCGKEPSFGVAGSRTAEYCTQHVPEEMIDVKGREKARIEGYGTDPSFGMAGSRMAEYCAHNIRLRCDVEGYMRRETGPHHSGEQTIGNASQSDVKRKISPCQASPLSGGIEGSCKRVRHLDTASTPLKRAVARASAAQAVTMPGIDGQKASVRQNSSVKTEVQVSL